MSSVSGKKEIPVLTVNSSEGEEENTSFLCSQNSEKEEDFIMLRQRAIRKLKRLVDKCCMKWIKFSQKYFNISKRLASNPSSVTDAELMELRTECLESLEACNVSFSSSSTSESGQEEPLKVKKKKLKRKSLVQSPPMYDPTNPYNVAYQMNPMYSRGTRHEARKHLSRYPHATHSTVHHGHYPYSRPNLYNPYSESVYSEYEHRQKSSLDQAPRQTSSPYPYPQRSRMDIEVVSPPQRHMQATPVWRVSTESMPHRQQSENFREEHSMEHQYTEDMRFSRHEHHMQGIPGMHTFSQRQFSSTSVPEQQISKFQMMATPSRESTYPPTPQPQTQTPVTAPFSKTTEMASFENLVHVDNSQVHISAPSTPVTDPLYSDTSLTPDQNAMQTDSPKVCSILFNHVNLQEPNYNSAFNVFQYTVKEI